MEHDRRRWLANAAMSGAVFGLASVSPSSIAAPITANNLITVGVGGDFLSIQDAINSVTDASSKNPYLIDVLPGVYIDAGFSMKSYVSVCGRERNAVQLILDDASNIIIADNATLSNMTLKFSGSSAALISRRSLTDFNLEDVNFEVNGSGAAFLSKSYIQRAVMRDINIVTQGVGLILNGGNLFIHDIDIHLVTSAQDNLHCAIHLNRSHCRVYVFGGKIGTGYGHPPPSDSGPVVGVFAAANTRGRIELHGIWSICRNNGRAKYANCVRVESDQLRARMHGGYFQAEGSNPDTVVNLGKGEIVNYGARIRNYRGGNVYSSNQIGLSRFTDADNDKRLRHGHGGLLLCDASNGPFTLLLPAGWLIETEQYIFKKTDNSPNSVTIRAGANQTIEGSRKHLLSKQYDTLHLRLGGDVWYIV